MKMTNEEFEQLRKQAIEADEKRTENLRVFLNNLSLDSDINKTVALEIATTIAFIEEDIERLKALGTNNFSDHETVWLSFWKPICSPRGRINEEQVKKELYDYKLLLDEVPKVYEELAGLSKPHTSAKAIIDRVYDRMIDKQIAFDDLAASATNGEVMFTVSYLKEYFDIN